MPQATGVSSSDTANYDNSWPLWTPPSSPAMSYTTTSPSASYSPWSGSKKKASDCTSALGGSGRTLRRTASDVNDITRGYGGGVSDNQSSVGGGGMDAAYNWLYRYAGNRESSGACAHFVRKALSAAGYNRCEGSMGNYAKNFGGSLASFGFKNMIGSYGSPAAAPIGSVLVYAPTCQDTKFWYAGHVEIKTPRGYFSDYGGPRSRVAISPSENNLQSGRCRRLIGVWIPPASPKFQACSRPPEK